MICQLLKPAVFYFLGWQYSTWLYIILKGQINGGAMMLSTKGVWCHPSANHSSNPCDTDCGHILSPTEMIYFTIVHNTSSHVNIQHQLQYFDIRIILLYSPGNYSQYILVPYLPTWVVMLQHGYLVLYRYCWRHVIYSYRIQTLV